MNEEKKTLQSLMDENRYGIITIPKEWFSADYNFLTYIMSHFIIIRCEYFLMSGELVYQAVSPLFDKIDNPANAPVYRIKIDTDENKKIKGVNVERFRTDTGEIK